MANNVTQYKLLISCPGDVKDEIKCIYDAIEQFNDSFSDTLGISIIGKHWRKNSYPQSGGKPQALLNKQIVNDCDAAVAIMWTRFGTPTDEYGSGTEEEIEIMLQDGKQVFMYFCDRPLPPSQMDSDGKRRVDAFRERYKDKGIYYSYASIEEFQKKFYAHLSQYFLSMKEIESIRNKRHSDLSIKGLNRENKISDNAELSTFSLQSEYDSDEYLALIKDYYSIIDSIKPVKKPEDPTSTTFSFIFPKVEIDQKEKEAITDFARLFKIEISGSFFDLGNLREDFGRALGYTNVKGTVEEENKYHKIYELYDYIQEFLKWSFANKDIKKLKSIGLVLANNGTDIDEDVEVTLSFPKSVLVTAVP